MSGGMRSERRSDDPGEERNWALDCSFAGCGERFPSTQIVADVADHWNTHEGKYTGQADQKNGHALIAEHDLPRLNLVWIGVGPCPPGKPNWVN